MLSGDYICTYAYFPVSGQGSCSKLRGTLCFQDTFLEKNHFPMDW